MTQDVGDRGLVFGVGGKNPVFVEVQRPSVGDKVILYPLGDGDKLAVPELKFEVGDVVWATPDNPWAPFEWNMPFDIPLISFNLLPCVSTLTGVADEVVEDTKKAWANDELIGKQLFMLSGARKNTKFQIIDNTETTYTVSTFGDIITGGDFESDTGVWVGYTVGGSPRVSELTIEAYHSSGHSWKLAMNTNSFFEAGVYQNNIDLTGITELSFYLNGTDISGSAFIQPTLYSGPNMTGGSSAGSILLPTSGWEKETITVPVTYQKSGVCLAFRLFQNGIAYIDDIHVAATGTGVAVGDRYVIWDPVEAKPYCGYAARLTKVDGGTLTDGYRSWTSSALIGKQIELLTGPNSGNKYDITANTKTTYTTASTGCESGNWYKIWDPATSTYIAIT